jgi:hypothetical protein
MGKKKVGMWEWVNVSEMAIIRRVNRRLKTRPLSGHEECQLFKTNSRDVEKRKIMGTFYLVADDEVIKRHVNLEAFARECGALLPYEAIA